MTRKKYVIWLANLMVAHDDGLMVAPYDAAICAKALRAYAARMGSGRVIALALLAVLPALAVGLIGDFKHSGSSTFADLVAGKNPFTVEASGR